MKNIPISDRNTYLNSLIQAADTFIRNLRWRAHFFLNPNEKASQKQTFGFKSIRSPPHVPELKPFEDGILELIKGVEFRNQHNQFQTELAKEVKKINNLNKPIIKADKTSNHYILDKETYNSLLEKNVQKEYKKESTDKIRSTNLRHKELVNKWEIQDRVFHTTPRQAFITLKDHKDSFENNPSCRLLNPAKPEIGRISKQILCKINAVIRKQTQLAQWKNSEETIEWFKKLENKDNLKFIQFDIVNFYPSISLDLLTKALKFAEKYLTITKEERETIVQSRKCYLYINGEPWSKKKNPDFDVPMGAWDGAECCDLVGLYMLMQLKRLDINIGLYRDDALGVCSATPRKVENVKKDICKIFKESNLNITIEANKKIVNFLDVSLDLGNNTYKPYMKLNDVPIYVHSKSNHPPSIIRNIPASVNKRLSTISANEDIFNKAAPAYQNALNQSGYSYQLTYNPNTKTQYPKKKHSRKRTITWFNPPFSKNVQTNVGEKFLKLIDKHFPKGSDLSKLINRNNVKISYRCLPNLENIISKHNAKVTRAPTDQTKVTCNCRKRDSCPLEGKCLTSSLVYQATVSSDICKEENYIGLTSNTFKQRWTQHTCSFKHKSKANETTLSQYIWKLKEQNVKYNIKWKIISKAPQFSPVTGRCNLCTKEKFYIIYRPEMCSLNTRNELGTHCRHKKKMLLDNT